MRRKKEVKTMVKPEGIIPALVTPFTEQGEVNETVLRELIRRTIASGCHGIFCLGSNGEFFALTNGEKLRIAEIAIEEAKGKVPVYMGTGSNSTGETIALTKKMEALGVTAVSVITPYFVKLSQEELMKHYEQIANAVNIPIILYNIPNLTGNALTPSTVERLAKIDNIVAIKDSSGNFDQVLQLIKLRNEGFSILVGTDSLILPGLMAGSNGAVAATANLLPETVVKIYSNWEKGDFIGAQEAQDKLQAIRNAFKLGTLPSVLKASLNASGIQVGNPRAPVSAVTDEVEEKIKAIVKSYQDQKQFG